MDPVEKAAGIGPALRHAFENTSMEDVARSAAGRLRLSNHLWPALPLLREDDLSDASSRNRVTALDETIHAGDYDVRAAHFVPLPKATRGWRSGCLFALEERVIFEGLVQKIAPAVEAALAPRRVLYGPRGPENFQRWWSFERAPLRASPRYVVVADSNDFGLKVRHEVIASNLLDVGADPAAVSALRMFLSVSMGSDVGIPQGMDAAASLMSAGINGIDRAMLAEGWRYMRCSDDFRIAVDNPAQGEDALAALAEKLSVVGLELSGAKSRVVSAYDYATALDKAWLSPLVWEKLSAPRTTRFLHGFFGCSTRRTLRRSRARIRAKSVYRQGLAAASEEGTGVSNGNLQARAVHILLDLQSINNDAAIEELPRLLETHPVLTPVVALYLRGVSWGAARDAALAVTEEILAIEGILDSQRAWLYRALLPAAEAARESLIRSAADDVGEQRGPVCRIEAARFMARRAELDPGLVSQLRELPQQMQSELELVAEGAEKGSTSPVDRGWAGIC